MQIKDAVGNDYGRPKDVAGETRMAFTSLADTAFDVCFENTLSGRRTPPPPPLLFFPAPSRRDINLDRTVSYLNT